MSDDFVLNATSREAFGTGASRRLRREGYVPAIIYGEGGSPEPIMLDHNELLHAGAEESFYASIIKIILDGKEQQAIIKDLQRHPFKRKLVHADFMRVSATSEFTVSVPLHFVGEQTCPAIKENGAILSRLYNEVEISCLPKDLPEYLEVDISKAEIDEIIHLSDLKVPAGVTITALEHGEDSDYAVASITMPRADKGSEDGEDADDSEQAADSGEDDK